MQELLSKTNDPNLPTSEQDFYELRLDDSDHIWRPISNNLIPDEKGVEICPSEDGATNWYSPSYNETTHMFYFRSLNACDIFTTKPEPFQEERTYFAGGTRRPPGETVKSVILVFDMDKLDLAWREPLVGLNYANAGVMSTATGLVAFGDNEQNFVIVDGRTGTPLWNFSVGQTIRSSPMSYAVKGKQYFAIAATGSGDLFSFALP